MPAQYELYLTTPLGVRLAAIDSFEQLEWMCRLNDIGWLSLTFGAEQADWRLYGLDNRVEVWRIIDAVPKLIGIYYLRYSGRTTSERGEQVVVWKGADANTLLDTRIVAYAAGSSQASKTSFADNMMKEVVIENLGASAGAGRDITALGFSVQAPLSQAPSITKSFSRQYVLSALQGIAEASRQAGTRLYFQIMHPTLTTLEFRTYINRLGADRTTLVTPFSLYRGDLAGPVSSTYDRRDERNFIYAAGQGVEAERQVITLSDATAIAASPFNRREGLADGRNYEATASLTNFGRNKLEEWRAKRVFEARLVDKPGSRYQYDWDFGDLVSAEYDETIYDCEVEAVMGVVTAAKETISARLTSYV